MKRKGTNNRQTLLVLAHRIGNSVQMHRVDNVCYFFARKRVIFSFMAEVYLNIF